MSSTYDMGAIAHTPQRVSVLDPGRVFLIVKRRAAISTLFPYSTLFRSRNILRGPGQWNIDFSIIKSTRIGGLTTRSEEHTSELQSQPKLVCRLLLENKKRRSTSPSRRKSSRRSSAWRASSAPPSSASPP